MRLTELLNTHRANPIDFPQTRVCGDDRPTLAVWLRRPDAKLAVLRDWIVARLGCEPDHGLFTTVETELKYEGYMAQQERQIEHLKNSSRRAIPEDFAYDGIPGLSREITSKLIRVRPTTLGQAARIPGVTPAAVAVLDVYLNLNCST